jgi:hypothetical protein
MSLCALVERETLGLRAHGLEHTTRLRRQPPFDSVPERRLAPRARRPQWSPRALLVLQREQRRTPSLRGGENTLQCSSAKSRLLWRRRTKHRAGTAKQSAPWGRCLLLAFLLMLAGAKLGPAPVAEEARVETIDRFVEEVMRTDALDIKDTLAVLEFVFSSLPDRVKVYPTENYFYFRFVHDGLTYGGNFRLDVRDRDQGKIQFGYYEELAPWKPEETGLERYMVLDASHGVEVARLDPLVYRVTYKGKSVVFELNDLSQVRPPAGSLGADETFLGPIFDESAVRFFLVFNRKLKIFHFVLDETVRVPDEFFALPGSDRILIGKRSGFAFYRDHRLPRKVLIGVYMVNSEVNNYYDGPFDQLPDNFIKGEELREAMIASDPSLKGKIGRLGHFPDEEQRFGIHPYMLYKDTGELLRFDRCAKARIKAPAYGRCFVAPERLTHGH